MSPPQTSTECQSHRRRPAEACSPGRQPDRCHHSLSIPLSWKIHRAQNRSRSIGSTSTFSNGIDEAVVNHLVRRDPRLESPGLHLLFHRSHNTCVENVTVERK